MTPDEAMKLLHDECDHYLDAVLAVRGEVERLRAIEARARRIAEWAPDEGDEQGDTARDILGEDRNV